MMRGATRSPISLAVFGTPGCPFLYAGLHRVCGRSKMGRLSIVLLVLLLE